MNFGIGIPDSLLAEIDELELDTELELLADEQDDVLELLHDDEEELEDDGDVELEPLLLDEGELELEDDAPIAIIAMLNIVPMFCINTISYTASIPG